MYNPTPVLLEGDAAALSAELLAAHVAIALEVMEIAGATFDEGERATVEHALALQVNYQVESFPTAVIASEGAAGQTAVYRRNKDGALPPLHPTAAQLIGRVIARAAAAVVRAPAAAYTVLRGLR